MSELQRYPAFQWFTDCGALQGTHYLRPYLGSDHALLLSSQRAATFLATLFWDIAGAALLDICGPVPSCGEHDARASLILQSRMGPLPRLLGLLFGPHLRFL